MTPTKYEGLYYRKNKYNKKVFYARFKVDGKSYKRTLGKEPQMSTTTANLARVELIGNMKGISSLVEDKRTVNDFFEEYVEDRRISLSDSWYYNINRNYIKHLKDIVGKLNPLEVKAMDVQKVINDMLTGVNGRTYAPSTVKQIKDCMSGLYRYIRKCGIKVPNMGAELNIPSFDNKIYFTISDEKAQMLFDAILEYDSIKWRTYFIWLLHGRRKMEVAKMRWEYIDFDNMLYRVPGEINKTSREILAPMTELLKRALENHGVHEGGFVFDGNSGSGHISSTGIDFHWRAIRQSVGLPKMRLHDIRHLIGFMGVNSGYSLEMIGSVLGHSSVATTKRYSNMKSDSARVVLGNMFDRFVKQ